MKKKNIYFIVLALVAVVFLSPSCTKDFEEINTNPNDPSIDQAAPDMLLTDGIEVMTDRIHNIFLGHEMGSCWVQHMAKVQYTDEDRYIPRVSVINAAWSSFYANSGVDIQTLYNIAESTDNESYQAVALVLRSYILSVLTDMFGDVPFNEAFQGAAEESILSPVYDTQEAIYEKMIADLALANTLLAADGAEIEGDILFNNDLVLWKKFANSLRLRLLLRRSDKVNPTEIMTAMINDPATYPIFEGTDEHAALPYLGSAPNNHPINENRKGRDDHRVSKSIIDLMWNEAPGGEPDYRVMAYAEVAEGSGAYMGLPNGMLAADAAAYEGNGLANTSKIGEYFTQATTPGMLLSYPELQFILAEAAHKGYISGGDAKAQEYYEEGIKSSYYMYAAEIEQGIVDYYGTNPGDYLIDDMLSWFLADGGFVYDPANAIEQIATQKWVAMFDQGLQAQFEWKRLDYPVLTPAVAGVNNGKIPVRVYYPSDEAARNPTNLAEAVSRLGGPDDLNTRVWWDVK